MIKNALGDFKDEVLDQVGGIAKVAKKQITAPAPQSQQDPIVDKPKPSKKMLNQLSQATTQLAQIRLKKVREELEKQRLKVTGPSSAKASAGEAGPEIPIDKPKPQDDAVAATLRNSQSTGEIGKNIGG